MAFTVTFHTTGASPEPEQLAEWLTEHGEPFEAEGSRTLVLRALPVRMRAQDEGPLQAHVDVEPRTPLMRLVDLLFDLSVLAGADLRLAGTGGVTRAGLWMALADEQDRQRLTKAIERAELHGKKEDVLQRLWQVLAALRPGHDVRWSIDAHAVVEMKEVGSSISLQDAEWLVAGCQPGDIVPVPVAEGYLHILAWRWLSESYPGLTEG